MSKAKDFQLATANHIIEIFKRGQKRVLLSDEVGLGKTIMARTVVENAKSLPGIETDGVFRIVYVCSNQNIIQQNTRNLGIPKEDIMQIQDSRLSMQHLILQERKSRFNNQCANELQQQLIPLTPSTSFSIKSGAGNGAERALLFSILKDMDEFAGKTERLSMLLKTKYMGESGWERLVRSYCDRTDKCGDDYKIDIVKRLRANSVFSKNFKSFIDIVDDASKEEISFKLVNKLRAASAQVSLDLLEPDLVIMDEFQRFSGLLNTDEESEDDKGTEEAMIANKFFSNEHPYILLLSATPYKPFTTLEELNESNCDEQYEDFLKLMKFLFKDEKAESESFHTIWEDYSKRLTHISSETFDVLFISKQRAEDKMYDVISRTERYREGLIKTVPLGNIKVTEDDILAYCQMQKLLQKAKEILEHKKNKGENIGVNPCYDMSVEYVKSCPYLLSFMQKYQEGKTVEVAFYGKDVPIAKRSRKQRLLLKGGDIYHYKAISPANAKLAAVENMLFKNKAEQLLWVPASRPYYTIPEDNVFAINKDFSKVLVFSAWEMVPRMLAIMLSYKSEQKNVGNAYKRATYTNKIGRQNDLEDLQNLLKYPSEYLADYYSPSNYLGQEVNGIIREVQNKIQADIDLLGLPLSDKTSAENLLNLLKKLEREEVKVDEIPPKAAKTLAYMAIASPAVCMLRILKGTVKPYSANSDYEISKAEDTAKEIVGLFKHREASAAIELSVPKELKSANYYEKVLHYCVIGNLQAVLDEFCHMIDGGEKGDAEFIVEKFKDSFIRPATYNIHTTDSYCKKDGKLMRMRRSFAFDYAKITNDKDSEHNGTLQQAFNSPFRPFVLATTSVGQEGLDFHWYARKIVHWNLPSNPIDLEQREGRINRYKCLAIRRNIAKFFGDKIFSWNEMFDEADKKWREESQSKYSEMVPCWCLPKEIISKSEEYGLEHIERVVPLYPMSLDEFKYRRLIEVLSLYRLTMGQPRQEELLQLLNGKISEEQIEKLLFNLSPYNRQ